MSPFYGWGNSINVRCPGLQNVLLCQAEPSPLETMGSAGLAPVTPLTSLHSVPMVLHACCFPNAPMGSGLRASTLVLPSTWTNPQVSEWLPPSNPFRSLLQYHLLNDSSCSCISTLNPIPSIPLSLFCFVLSTALIIFRQSVVLICLFIVYFAHQNVSSTRAESFVGFVRHYLLDP